jgi:predicted metal-binding transcription factor (methanogenesis marker protein 9)
MTPVSTVTRAMSMAEIKEKARNHGIDPGNMKKIELIHAIQRSEGNNTCYGTTNGTCSQTLCCWRTDCLKIKK